MAYDSIGGIRYSCTMRQALLHSPVRALNFLMGDIGAIGTTPTIGVNEA
jgi:hypothetical protein